MTKKISGSEYPLSKIFSSDFDEIVQKRQADLLQVFAEQWELT